MCDSDVGQVKNNVAGFVENESSVGSAGVLILRERGIRVKKKKTGVTSLRFSPPLFAEEVLVLVCVGDGPLYHLVANRGHD